MDGQSIQLRRFMTNAELASAIHAAREMLDGVGTIHSYHGALVAHLQVLLLEQQIRAKLNSSQA